MPTVTPSLPMLPSDPTILPHMHLLYSMQPCLLQHPQLTVQRGSFGKPVCNPSQTQADSTQFSPETVPSKNYSSLPPVSSDSAEDEQAHPAANTRRLRKVSKKVQTEQNLESTVPSCNKRNIPRYNHMLNKFIFLYAFCIFALIYKSSIFFYLVDFSEVCQYLQNFLLKKRGGGFILISNSFC